MKPTENNQNHETKLQPNCNTAGSRFSRRRFLQSAAVTSPLLFTVKSPVAWGTTGTAQCSITAVLSGNASNPGNCQSAARSAEYWQRVFTAVSGNPEYPVLQALRANNITKTTQFMSLFLHGWENNSYDASSRWYYRLYLQDCDNPSIWDVLQAGSTASYKVKFLFVKRRNNRKNRKEYINIFEYPAGFVQSLVVAYLNSLFPTAIDYPYTSLTLNGRLDSAVDSSVNTQLALLKRTRPKPGVMDVFKPFISMKSEIETWS
ncbi:hypothetical protein NF212_18135 [Parasalinivibrio latis]|uniref:hypothetical protein n=1 Tax=Parasalinivibrio latis TaxID=2952610 RepID=UPI0030E059D6